MFSPFERCEDVADQLLAKVSPAEGCYQGGLPIDGLRPV
jgi:hypothetical protein